MKKYLVMPSPSPHTSLLNYNEIYRPRHENNLYRRTTGLRFTSLYPTPPIPFRYFKGLKSWDLEVEWLALKLTIYEISRLQCFIPEIPGFRKWLGIAISTKLIPTPKLYPQYIAFPILPLNKNHGEEENDKMGVNVRYPQPSDCYIML